jgi:hypothetical protein
VGTECEASIGVIAGAPEWYRVTVVAHHWKRAVVYSAQLDQYHGATADRLRPIKFERDRQIDAIEALIYRSECETTSAAERLYNAGCRIGGVE